MKQADEIIEKTSRFLMTSMVSELEPIVVTEAKGAVRMHTKDDTAAYDHRTKQSSAEKVNLSISRWNMDQLQVKTQFRNWFSA